MGFKKKLLDCLKKKYEYLWDGGGGERGKACMFAWKERNIIRWNLNGFQKGKRPSRKSVVLPPHPNPKCIYWLTASVSSGSLLEMLNLRPHPRAIESTRSFKTLTGLLCTWKFGKYWSVIFLSWLGRYWLTLLPSSFRRWCWGGFVVVQGRWLIQCKVCQASWFSAFPSSRSPLTQFSL